MDLKILHEISFFGILQPDWNSFRDATRVEVANDDGSKQYTKLEQLIHTAGAECGHFLIKNEDGVERASMPKERISKLAAYHSALTEIRPFRDDRDSPVINRIVAGIVLESQLRHCFKGDKLGLKADAEDYEAALRAAHDHGAFKPLERVVQTLAGEAYHISRFQSRE